MRHEPIITGAHAPVTIKLDSAGLQRVAQGGVLYVVTEFDGDADSVYIQTHENPNIGGRRELALHSSDRFASRQQFWIYNKIAQPGKTLVLKIGLPGASFSPGQAGDSAFGTATEETQAGILDALGNQPTIVTGQKTVPTGTAQAIGASQAIPEGFALVIQADDENSFPVWVGPDADMTSSTGKKLAPGHAIEYRVQNVSAVFCLAENASQKLDYTVEVAE